MNVGDKIQVKLVEVDKKTGKYRLSAKALLPRPEGMPEPQPRRERPEGERREGGFKGGNDRRGNDNRNRR